MPTHTDVLARLREQLDSDDLAETVSRFLRLPEIWAMLADPEAEEVASDDGRKSLKPDTIALGGLPGQFPSPDPSALPADLRTDLERLVTGGADNTSDAGTASVGLRALALLELESQTDGYRSIVDRVQSRPDLWQTPLACAWPHFADNHAILSELVSGGDLVSVKAATVSLLSHNATEAAAASLVNSYAQPKHRLIRHLHDLGEDQLAEAIARQILASDDPSRSRRHDPIETLIDQAAAHERVNGPNAAQNLLDAAWERAGQIRAEIADRLADIAVGAGEPVVAAEALRKAMGENPTNDRKARAALALIDAGHIDDGLAMLPASPEETTDSIAVGLAYAKDNRQTEATHYLLSAAEEVTDGESLHPRWMGRLTRALIDADRPGEAAQVAAIWSDAAPGSRGARVALAEARFAAGDAAGAGNMAELLLVQDENDDHVRGILAQCLQAQGKPEQALEHWQQLALANARMLKQVVACALEANQADLARDQAARWLALDPDSPQALVQYGRALTATGDVETAKDHLTQATERAPQSPETWLALAEAQRATGDNASADDTLTRAIQICPDQASLLTAKGRSLAEQDHLSEALEHYERALRLSENDPEIQLGYGQLLAKLGHIEQAMPVLEKAHAHRSAHLPTRVALAEAYETVGDILAAHELVSDIPDGASDQAQLLAGRLAVKAAIRTNDIQLAERGLHRLRLVSTAASDPDHAYWMAEGLRMTGQPEEAMATYQTCLNGEPGLTGDKHTRASMGLAQAAMAAGQTPVAISILETLRQGSGGSPESLLLLSKAYRKAGLADEALAPAMEAVERDPSNADARAEAVAASMESEAWGAALTQINHWTEASPDDPAVWIQKAQLHHQLSQPEDARAALARALRLGGTDPSTVGPVSQLLTRLGKPQQAVRLLKRAASAAPDDDVILKALAETAERTEDFDSALEAWTALSERSPEDLMALRHVGESLWRLHRRSAAIGYWQRGLTQDPKNVGLAIRLAHAHLENGEPDRGLEHLRQALSLCPDDPQLAVETAAAFRLHGAPEEALEILQTASALVPGDASIREAIADTFTEMDSHAEARQVLADLADKDTPASPSVLAKLSLAEMALGNTLASFEAFDRIDPTQLRSAQDALWTAQAGFNHAAWPKVLSAVEGAIERVEGDPDLLVKAIEWRARLADATWVYEEGAKAKAHSPQAPTVAPETASAWIEKSRRVGLDEITCQQLDQQLALVAGRIPADRVDQDTASPAMIESLIIAHLRQGEAEAVIALLAENPGARQNEWAPLLAGLAHLKSGRYAQALKAFGAVSAVPALKPLAAYFTALAHLQQGQMSDAIDALNAALAAWPDEPTWHHTLAQAYAATEEIDMALPHFQQASELEPENGIYCLSLAKHLQAMGVHHQAEEHFVHALQYFPEDSEVWRQAGYASLAIGASDEALIRFRRASELAPEDFDARIGAARAAQASGQIATALQWASQAVDLAPDNARALMGWADILSLQGKHDKALSAYQRAEAGMADPSQAQRARSRLFMQTGRPEAAALELMKVVENRPDDEAAWSGLALAYEQSGDIKEAAAAVKKALAIAPAAVAHRLSLARLSRKSGQLDHALSELSTLQVEHPDSTEVAYELARVHEARRDFEKAMDGYRRTISLDKGHAKAHYRAGLVLKALKDYDQAAVMFKSAVDLSPHDADAHHQLAAVRALELVHGGIQQTPAVAQ